MPAPSMSFEVKAEIPGSNIGEDDKLTYLAKALSRNDRTSRVAYATEAGLFEKAGIPSIICGPGSIEQAHKPNEYVSLDQLGQCEAFLRRLMSRVCG